MMSIEQNNFFIKKLYELSIDKQETVAIKDGTNDINYGQLWEKIQSLQKMIKKETNGQSLPIVIWQDRGSDFIISMMACLAAGCFYVPDNWRFTL